MGPRFAFGEVHEAFTMDGFGKGVGKLVFWEPYFSKYKAVGTVPWIFSD